MDALVGNEKCPNCESTLTGDFKFCPYCGQNVLKKSDFSFRHMIIDSIGDYFHFDGKFVHSLVPLLIQPGKMTVEYLEGKRARFIAPFKLVLFISVVYFIVVGMTFRFDLKDTSQGTPVTLKDDTTAVASQNPLDLNITYGKRVMPLDSVQQAVKEKGADAFIDDLDPSSSWFSRTIAYQVVNFAVQGPEVFVKKMIHNASKVIFLLIPFTALLFNLLYLRRKKQYYDHLIFSIHFHAFLFIVLLLYQLIGFWLFDISGWIVLAVTLIYLLFAMKRVYQQGWLRSISKMILMVFMYLTIAVPVFIMLLLVISVIL